MILRSSLVALCAVAVQASSASSAVAADGAGSAGWLAQRAQLFSQVCMAAAPGFLDFETHAKAASLSQTENGWHMAPEVLIDVLQHDSFCSCFMTVMAPDQNAMITAIHAQLMQDYGSDYSGPESGLATVAPFDRGGIEVVSILEPREFNGDKWVAARLSVFGPCAEAEKTK